MKRLAMIAVLISLAAPCWAGDPEGSVVAELPAIAATGINHDLGRVVTGCTYRLLKFAGIYRVTLVSDERAGVGFSVDLPEDLVPLSEGQMASVDGAQLSYSDGVLTVRRKEPASGVAFGSNGLETLKIELTPDLLRPYRAEARAWSTFFFVTTGRDQELRCGF